MDTKKKYIVYKQKNKVKNMEKEDAIKIVLNPKIIIIVENPNGSSPNQITRSFTWRTPSITASAGNNALLSVRLECCVLFDDLYRFL